MKYSLAVARKLDLGRFLGEIVAPQAERSPWVCYGAAVVLPLVGFLVNWIVFDLERGPYFFLFIATVVIAALSGGRGPGIVSTLISTLLGFLVAPPAWTFRLSDPEDPLRIALFAVIGILISILLGTLGELQRNLNRERSILETILHSIGDAVITTDQHARITFLNDIAEITTGWRLEEVIGKPVDDIFHTVPEDSRQPARTPPGMILRAGNRADQVANCFLVRRDGNRIPIVYSVGSTDSPKSGMPAGVLTFRDVTRQRETYQALMRSEKLAVVGKLSATLAHNVNNPLAAISNLLYLIRSAPDLESAHSHAETAVQQVMRASHFVHQMLTFVKPSQNRRFVELDKLVDRVLALHADTLPPRQIAISRRFASGVLVWANPSEMEQVVSNLISNALDAIGRGGTLHLRIHQRGAKAVLLVADTGSGVTSEHLARFFSAFFTTKSGVGVGLGLWVAKQIIDAHEGRIRARSVVGKGTIVRIAVPAAVQP